MALKKHKVLKISLIVVSCTILVVLALNWYLSSRLESFLKKELSRKVSEATDGFYTLSFEHLSIDFFSGELSIKNIDFRPDSAIFRQWEAIDSLPGNYFKAHIKSIDFEGVNLIWQISYKRLNFGLFQIKSPHIEIYESYYSARFKKKTKNIQQKSLYETIKPYIDVLSVKKMNLENANVVYKVEDPDASGVYSLHNANFHAYGFLIDEDSDVNGKLLYCDEFDFSTNRPQVLLANRQFILNTDSVRLSTQDSIIKVSGISLLGQDSIWAKDGGIPDSYINAKIESLEVKGVYFERENSLTYLNARSFDIVSSDIKYYVSDKTNHSKVQDKNLAMKDSILQMTPDSLSWTLYDIISPILYSVSINEIGLQKARFKYTLTGESATDVYTLDKLDFRASGFRVDSLSGEDNRFMYSIGYMLDASEINGKMESNNHDLNVEHILLDTEKGVLKVENVRLFPIAKKSRLDYLQGRIDTIAVDGLVYDKGVKAQRLRIESPDVRYVHNSDFKGGSQPGNNNIQNQNAIKSLMSPYLGYLSIKEILLNNADLKFYDNVTKGGASYRIRNFNFFAHNFLIDSTTFDSRYGFFECDNFGFRFSNFDNLLPGKEYRLFVKDAMFSGKSGNLTLRDVKLVPQKDTWQKSPDSYVNITAPLIDVKGMFLSDNKVRISDFNIQSPDIEVTKERNPTNKRMGKNKVGKTSSIQGINSLDLGTVTMGDANIKYWDKITGDSMRTSLGLLQLKNIYWGNSNSKRFRIDDIYLKDPKINLTVNEKAGDELSTVIDPDKNMSNPFADVLDLRKTDISGLAFSAKFPDMDIVADFNDLRLSGLLWNMDEKDSSFKLDEFTLASPSADIVSHRPDSTSEPLQKKSREEAEEDFYAMLDDYAKKIFIGKFNITNANVDFSTSDKDKLLVDDRENRTDFYMEGLNINNQEKTFRLDDIRLGTRNLRFPIYNGFYIIKIDSVGISEKASKIYVDKLHMDARYPKMEYAYRHPIHKDWFDLTVGNTVIEGINLEKYFSNQVLEVSDLQVNDVVLQNFKNQKIEIQHNVMPLIYEGLQRAPLKFTAKNADVKNFSVIYEELPKDGEIPGVISLTGLNGHLDGLTNIVTHRDQYINLTADGVFMDAGYFTANWLIPVDTLNDCFVLDAHLQKFNLKDLNKLITPMASVEAETGILNENRFRIQASSEEANIDMLFLYDNLKVNVLKAKDSHADRNRFATFLANQIIRSSNPRKKNGKPHKVHLAIVRDPYHSTFNYFWQALQPALVESVGVSQSTQNFGRKVANFINKVKNFFSPGKKDKKEKTEK